MKIQGKVKNSHHPFFLIHVTIRCLISDHCCVKNDFSEIIRAFKCIRKEFYIMYQMIIQMKSDCLKKMIKRSKSLSTE